LGGHYCQYVLGVITDTGTILLPLVQTSQIDLLLSLTPLNGLLQWGKYCLKTS